MEDDSFKEVGLRAGWVREKGQSNDEEKWAIYFLYLNYGVDQEQQIVSGPLMT